MTKLLEYTIKVGEKNNGVRIDHYLMNYISEKEKSFKNLDIVFTRTKIQKFIQNGNILINDLLVKQSYIIKKNEKNNQTT